MSRRRFQIGAFVLPSSHDERDCYYGQVKIGAAQVTLEGRKAATANQRVPSPDNGRSNPAPDTAGLSVDLVADVTAAFRIPVPGTCGASKIQQTKNRNAL